MGLAVLHVAASYPALPIVSPCWPTSDGWIPWRLFLWAFRELPRVMALQRLREAGAVAQGIANAFAGDEHGQLEIELLLEKTIELALPRVGGERKAPIVLFGPDGEAATT